MAEYPAWLARGIWDAALTIAINVIAFFLALIVLSFPGLPA